MCGTPSIPYPKPFLIDPPPRPFEHIAADLFQLGGKQVLVGDPPADPPSVHAPVQLRHCKSSTCNLQPATWWVADKGIPVRLTTDGGPRLIPLACKQFCDGWGTHYTVSSPHHRQAIKALLSKKTANGNINIDDLLEFRNTSRTNGFTPSQLLFSWPLQSQVLAHSSTFKQE